MSDTSYTPGSKLVIRFNPHHGPGAEEIVATVTRFEPGAGFMGCDLVHVRYQLPHDGSERELPFATYNLEPGDRESLLARAERHEAQAAQLRQMAEEVSP